ncbi:ThiF family adenylyltransferase [Thiohalobacter thiocyanaticus]|uniref:Thiamine biosynthesis protein ThiF n=1 Tax=Thiohalobacter thiocyanaticus TaxID=585455 RepID=A0A426QM41_9GAMM|nr:ThiF family adenylyltransferase [Thiohalobacter thiocyanaticus]RRQ22819.1 thiamine biosynthesis protein ThiF [Thiohalobacter thiocyanaticus]
MTPPAFDYQEAFSRNLGWVTPREQAVLRDRRVAIAGMGGVGGSHLLTLTRLGVGAFSIADFDDFELANFNRQAGATYSTLGRSKVGVLADMAADINPELSLRRFPDGVGEADLEAFLADCDLYIDGLDFFAMAIRRAMFAACRRLGIPAVTAAPLGMGTAVLCFLPGGMSFEDYFRLDGADETEQLLRFLVGLAPAGLHRAYLVDPRSIDLARHRGPSTSMGCELAAGAAASQALKLLLNRGPVLAAPRGIQYDAYRNRARHTWRPGGNRHPLQQLTLALARRQMQRLAATAPAPGASPRPEGRLERVLDLARWAPSGDNTQPWSFERIDDNRFIIQGHDTRAHCVYDLNGHASQLAVGTLLATARIAASGEGCRLDTEFEPDSRAEAPRLRVRLTPDETVQPDPLRHFITHRAVQRRPLSTRPLTAREKAALEAAVGPDYRLVWQEGWRARQRMAGLLSLNGKLRLTLPEAYPTHSSIIEWHARYSDDRIPEQAVGVDYLTARLMQWVLGSWSRVSFMNRYLAGTLMPRLQLDILPALLCGAHFLLVARRPPADYRGYIGGGEAVQRLWLTASRLGLQLQPEYTPLVFDEYVRTQTPFTDHAPSQARARQVSERLRQLFGQPESDGAVFLGRIGAGQPPRSRSTRRALADLMPGN